MPSLALGQKSQLAKLFNEFLGRRGFAAGAADVFDVQAKEGTSQLQQWLIDLDPGSRKGRIQVDGSPGNQTLGYACAIDKDDDLDPPAIANAVGVAYPVRLASLPLSIAATTDQHLRRDCRQTRTDRFQPRANQHHQRL